MLQVQVTVWTVDTKHLGMTAITGSVRHPE